MSYVQNNLLPGENITKQAKIHWFVYVPGALLLMIWLFLPSAPEKGPSMFFLMLALVLLTNAAIKTISTELAVTNRRVIAKHGFIARKSIELNLVKVESLAIDQSTLGRIFNYGTITVNGTGGVHTPFKFIASPLPVRKAVNEEFEKTSERTAA